MMKKIVEMLAVAMIVLVAGAVFFRVVGAIPVSVTQTQKQSTFDVSGEGKAAVAPDQAEITLGVHKEGASVDRVTEEVDQTMQELSKELRALGVGENDMQTTSYSVNPNYNPDGKPDQYTVNSNVRVVIKDLKKAGQVVDLIGKLGLEQSGNLSFTLSDTLKAETLKTAREQAIAEAKKKAEELAGLAGMTLGRIVNVQEGYNNQPSPYIMREMSAKDAGGSATPAQLEPGTSEVAVIVTLSYETR